MKRDRDILTLICVLIGLSGWVMWESIPPATGVRAITHAEVLASRARLGEIASRSAALPTDEGSKATAPLLETTQPTVVLTQKAGLLMGSQAFSTAGAMTFTPDAGVTSIDIVMIGGGGSGEAAGGGGGGGGGESRVITGHSCTPGVGITGSVGAAGVSSADGGNTSLALFSATGGKRGGGVSSGTGGLGGTGGSGGTGYSGGNGGTWATGVAGGGGGAAGATGAGSNGGPTTGGTGNSPGGNGGNGGDPPSNASGYGGGGGGSSGMTDGGNGTVGYILITWTDPASVSVAACAAFSNQPLGNDGDLITMLKNTSGQKIGAQMVNATTGAAFTSSVTVYVTGDAGTQAAGSVGSGACTHEGNGYHTYAPAQAETNYDLIGFTFVGSGAVPATIQAATVAAVPLDAAGVRSAVGLTSANLDSQLTAIDDAIDTEVAAIKAKTDLIPAAPAAVGDCITAAGVRSAVGLATANLDTQLTPLGTGFTRAVKAITLGTVDTGATTTIIPTSSLSPAAVDANQFRGQVVCFANDTTTTALRGQKTDITGSSSGGILTVNELTSTPVSGDTFTIQ